MSSKKIISEDEFHKECSSIENVFFIQIGANDGVSFDPIHTMIVENDWSGVLVEPGADAFRELQSTYNGYTKLKLLNCAVSDNDGFIDLYCGSTTPHFTVDWIKAKHMFDVEPRAVKVPCLSMKTLLNKYTINNKLDILQIDAEGHDHIILKNFDFENYNPKIIRFEYVSIEDKLLNECLANLTHFGYTLNYSSDGADVIAIR